MLLSCSPVGDVPEPIILFQEAHNTVRKSVYGKPNVCLRFRLEPLGSRAKLNTATWVFYV